MIGLGVLGLGSVRLASGCMACVDVFTLVFLARKKSGYRKGEVGGDTLLSELVLFKPV